MRAFLRSVIPSLLVVAAMALVAVAPAQPFNIFPVTNVWRYMANTNNQTFCLDGTGWEMAAYDDSGWTNGPGGFTGGENTAATLTSLAGLLTTTNLPSPQAGLGRPQYFRTHFNIASPNDLSLVFSNRIDDQAVFYLNGTRIADYRHPNTPASCTPGGAGGDEATAWVVITLDATQLAGIIQQGDNVLAVSVHQNTANSSDMVFACILTGVISYPPVINYAASSLSNRTLLQCRSTTLSVSASGYPLPTYQWFHDGAVMAGATNSSLTLSNMQASDAGNYFVQVCNTRGCSNTTPTTVVSYVADTAPPSIVSVIGNDNLTNITVVFNEPFNTNNLIDVPFNFTLTDTNTGTVLMIFEGTAPSDTTLVLNTEIRDPTHGYALTVSGIQDACVGNVMPTTAVPVATFLQPLFALSGSALWKYEQSGTNLSGWTAPAYNDSGWLTGAGTFDAKRTNATSPFPLCRPFIPTNNEPVRTCLTLSNAPSTAQIPTIYFRKQFNFSGDPAGAVLRLITLVDDGAVFYLNGVELRRLGMGTGVIGYTTAATRTIGEAYFETNDVPAPSLVDGLNTLAVELHQVNLTSSDITFGLQLKKYSATPLAPLAPEIATQPQAQSVVSGGTATFSVVVDGDAPFAYQWHANCRSIAKATNAMLTISNVGPLSVGTYSVTIRNAAGQVTSGDATLALSDVVPTLIQSSLAGGNFNLQWPVRDIAYQLQETPSLNVTPAAWSLSEEYIIRVGTNQTASFSAVGQRFFRLAEPPLRIVQQPQGRSVGLGETVALSVTATGAPPLTYQWRLNGFDVPGATNPVLDLTVTNQAQYGAYIVAVDNATGSVGSRPAVLRPAGFQTILTDAFANRPLFRDAPGSIHGINYGASREQDEPNHAGLPGGKSVWLKWRGPASGVATFDTVGSGIDTLLAAYTGSSVGALTPVASDDDSAARLGSRIRFNVISNAEYNIAIDGLAGAEGFIALNWSFTPLPPTSTIPIIDVQPQDQIVPSNTLATFTVQAHGLAPLTNLSYQWYFNGNPIPAGQGGTSPSLRVGPGSGNAPALLGPYSVDVMNTNAALTVRSLAAFLQFSTNPELRFVIKPIADLLCDPTLIGPPNCCGGGGLAPDGGARPKVLPPGVGLTVGSLIDGVKPAAASGKIESWAWVTNSWSSGTRVRITNQVSTALGYSQLELIPSNNIANYKITTVPASKSANPKAGLYPSSIIPETAVVHWIGAGRTPSNAASFSVSYTQ